MSAASKFAYSLPIEVTLKDLDGLGHVNNAVYLTYLETARNRYVLALQDLKSLHDFNFILARTVIDFRSAAEFAETLLVRLWPTRIGNTSFTFGYTIVADRDQRLLVEAESVQVCFNYQSQKPMPIPAELRRKLEAELKRCQP